MNRLDDFLHANRLKQVDLVNYLKVTKGYISLVMKGKKTLSKENIGKLLNNPYGWDTSMLTESESASGAVQSQEDVLIAELRSKIEKLESKIDHLNQELGEKNALLKIMSQGGGASVQVAGGSSVADVG